MVIELKVIDMICELEFFFPQQCDYKIRPTVKILIVNCSFHRLQKIPKLSPIPIQSIHLEHVELFINKNNLTELPTANYTLFNNITIILASNNQIHSIGFLTT